MANLDRKKGKVNSRKKKEDISNFDQSVFDDPILLLDYLDKIDNKNIGEIKLSDKKNKESESKEETKRTTESLYKYEIVKEIAVLSEKGNGWSKQLNLVSWNEGKPKFDIREWAPDHQKMGKGITLTAAEAKCLVDALEKLELL